MRKNYFHPKNLDGVYSVYQIEGLNQDRLIKNLKNGGLTLYNVKHIALIIASSSVEKYIEKLDDYDRIFGYKPNTEVFKPKGCFEILR